MASRTLAIAEAGRARGRTLSERSEATIMRSALLLLAALALPAFGCANSTAVHAEAALGRVVVYRNGIAYFERTAEVKGEDFELSVPADKVDDFLKSLTVLDAKTKQPAPIAYPTRLSGDGSGLVKMK